MMIEQCGWQLSFSHLISGFATSQNSACCVEVRTISLLLLLFFLPAGPGGVGFELICIAEKSSNPDYVGNPQGGDENNPIKVSYYPRFHFPSPLFIVFLPAGPGLAPFVKISLIDFQNLLSAWLRPCNSPRPTHNPKHQSPNLYRRLLSLPSQRGCPVSCRQAWRSY